jgi:hypothetical protein
MPTRRPVTGVELLAMICLMRSAAASLRLITFGLDLAITIPPAAA